MFKKYFSYLFITRTYLLMCTAAHGCKSRGTRHRGQAHPEFAVGDPKANDTLESFLSKVAFKSDF